jgi:hypothetical protein
MYQFQDQNLTLNNTFFNNKAFVLKGPFFLGTSEPVTTTIIEQPTIVSTPTYSTVIYTNTNRNTNRNTNTNQNSNKGNTNRNQEKDEDDEEVNQVGPRSTQNRQGSGPMGNQITTVRNQIRARQSNDPMSNQLNQKSSNTRLIEQLNNLNKNKNNPPQ